MIPIHFELPVSQRVLSLAQKYIKTIRGSELTREVGDKIMRGIFQQIEENRDTEDRYFEISAGIHAVMDCILRQAGESISYTYARKHPLFEGMLDAVNIWAARHAQTIAPVYKSLFEGFLISANSCYQMARFDIAGRRAYNVSPGLASQLAATSLKGVGADDLRLPYSSIYCAVPPEANLKVWNRDTGLHRCIGIYVCDEPAIEIRDLENLTPQDGELQTSRGWRVMLIGEGRAHEWDDAILYFQIPLISGKLVDECLDLEQKYMRAVVEAVYIREGFGAEEHWVACWSWLMNAVLYATYVEPGERWEENEEARNLWKRIEKLPKGEKRERLKERLRGLPKKPRILLGQSVRVQRGREFEASEVARAARGTLALRVQVAGHWKRIAHGSGRTERRWQWIEPYWRGQGIELPSKRHDLGSI